MIVNALWENPIQQITHKPMNNRKTSIILTFSKEPNPEAPERVGNLLRKSYLNRIITESRH